MNQELLDRLDALAATLGVTISHLWGVLCRQAYVDFFVALGFLVFALVVMIGAMVWAARSEGDQNDIAVGVGVAALIGAGIALMGVAYTIGGALNPEYFAFQEVSRLFKETSQ